MGNYESMEMDRFYLLDNLDVSLNQCFITLDSQNLITEIRYNKRPVLKVQYDAEGGIIYYEDKKGNWWDKSKCRYSYPYGSIFNFMQVDNVKWGDDSPYSDNNDVTIYIQKAEYQDRMGEFIRDSNFPDNGFRVIANAILITEHLKLTAERKVFIEGNNVNNISTYKILKPFMNWGDDKKIFHHG